MNASTLSALLVISSTTLISVGHAKTVNSKLICGLLSRPGGHALHVISDDAQSFAFEGYSDAMSSRREKNAHSYEDSVLHSEGQLVCLEAKITASNGIRTLDVTHYLGEGQKLCGNIVEEAHDGTWIEVKNPKDSHSYIPYVLNLNSGDKKRDDANLGIISKHIAKDSTVCVTGFVQLDGNDDRNSDAKNPYGRLAIRVYSAKASK